MFISSLLQYSRKQDCKSRMKGRVAILPVSLEGPGQIRPVRRSVRKIITNVKSRIHKILLVLFISTLTTAAFLFWTGEHWFSTEEMQLLETSMRKWKFETGMCDRCNAYNHRRVIIPKGICAQSDYGKNPEILIMVSTIHQHRKFRCYIRNTWGSYSLNNRGKVRVLFLFGKDPGKNLTEEKMLQEEAEQFGDILQDDFNSTYRRGGEVQLIMGYEWAVKYCSNVKHVLKVSDDTFVNVPKILQLVSQTNLSNSIWGQCWNLSYPLRDKTHRWYVSPSEWPAEKYPKYCAGAYMGTTFDVIRKILLISPYVAWSSGNDDVLVGMCIEKLAIPTKDIPGFYVWNRVNPCSMKAPIYVLHTHGYPPEILQYFWSRRDKCFE